MFIIAVLDIALFALHADPIILLNLQYLNLGIFLVILLGSLIKYFQLRQGGKSIVDLIQATPIERSDPEPKYQQLVNIVDEMSIAAGIAAPMLYVLENEPGINAFVAGYIPNDTVLVVTRGLLENLSRDELQGVVAHEYSHIYNSDATLNLRLMIVLAGLLFVSQIGFRMIRVKNDRKGQVTMLGAVLLAFGYIGLFCGSIIKAAISRQRESLADASAVQFTRNPNGIASALLKIQQQADKALLVNKHAEQISHMCFSKAQRTTFFSWFATHPSIDVRVTAIDPTGVVRAEFLQTKNQSQPAQTAIKPKELDPVAMVTAIAAIPAAMLLKTIGNPTASNFVQAEKILASIPAPLKIMLNNYLDAQALVYAMFLAQDLTIDSSNLKINQDLQAKIKAAMQYSELADGSLRLVLLDLVVPVLRTAPQQVTSDFLQNLYDLIKADNKLNIFEVAMFTILTQTLHADAYKPIKAKYFNAMDLKGEIILLLAFMATQGARKVDQQQQAFEAALLHLQFNNTIALAQFELSLPGIMQDLKQLRYMASMLKKQFLEACVMCVNNDGVIAVAEAELLRAVCACLDCPMPLLTDK